jgi:hypothetical protein
MCTAEPSQWINKAVLFWPRISSGRSTTLGGSDYARHDAADALIARSGMADPDVTTARLLLAEYERLKDEQRTRIGFRDNLIYVTLASMAGVITASLAAKGHANLLLLLPPVSAVLGWTYLVNDEKVSAIGRYIREHLALELDPAGRAFGWENAHRSDARRRHRKILQVVVDLGTFCAPALAAIVIYWINGPRSWAFMVVSFAEMVVVLAVAVEVVRYADIGPARP